MTQITVAEMTPTIGATIAGLDLRSNLTAGTIAELRALWLEHQVLFFRDQDLTLDEQRAFACQFGDLWIHPYLPAPAEHPEVLVVRVKDSASKAPGEGWHSDMSASECPPSASILRLEKVPAAGGDTLFASMYAAYEALSDHWKRFLDPLDAWHSGAARHGGQFKLAAAQDHAPALHPVVRTHPETGRKALYVNRGFTMSVDTMSAAESAAVLGFLFDHCEQPAFQVRFSWQPNSIAMWDNRCVMHHAIFDYEPSQRLGYRFTVTGERPTRTG